MLTLVEARYYRCLRYVSQPLEGFHVLVGPNASGKTTFLDVVAFLGRVVSDGVMAALDERAATFGDMIWRKDGACFELAVEAAIPESKKKMLENSWDTLRYQIRIGEQGSGEVGILDERALLKQGNPLKKMEGLVFFPVDREVPDSILQGKARAGERTILNKSSEGIDHFYLEVEEKPGKGWYPSIRLGPRKSALANLHEDESRFPVFSWFKQLLAEGVQSVVLNSLAIRKPSPPGQGRLFKPDGSNLPWVVDDLARNHPERFAAWNRHVQTALPDIEIIKTIERPEDRHRYLVIRYKNGLEVPSWLCSDGTLRLLALTIPAYLMDFGGIYLIEEPENGIHPTAVETVYQSLSSVYDAQILMATHSPVILGNASPEKVLCFQKTTSGSTDIVSGDRHPKLRDWQGQVSLATLFAGGVLG